MGPFAQLGPIDPTVQNDFNPVDERTNQKIGVSVEDVKSYIQFIKSTVGITHEDELIKALEALVNKVHPLALGNVERFIQQSRMIASKLLKTHMSDESDKHAIDEIIENMASKLYFHGHPISRQEARDDLRLLTVAESDRKIDDALWELYREYESLFEMNTIMNPAFEIGKMRAAASGAHQSAYQNAYSAAISSGANAAQAIQLAAVHAQNTQPPVVYELEAPVIAIDSEGLQSLLVIKNRWELLPETTPGETRLRAETLEQGWRHTESSATQAQAGSTQAVAAAPATLAP